jgi:hypothetical protein
LRVAPLETSYFSIVAVQLRQLPIRQLALYVLARPPRCGAHTELHEAFPSGKGLRQRAISTRDARQRIREASSGVSSRCGLSHIGFETESPSDETEPESYTFPRESSRSCGSGTASIGNAPKPPTPTRSGCTPSWCGRSGKLADPTDLEFDEDRLDDPDALAAAVDDLLAASRIGRPASLPVTSDKDSAAQRRSPSACSAYSKNAPEPSLLGWLAEWHLKKMGAVVGAMRRSRGIPWLRRSPQRSTDTLNP